MLRYSEVGLFVKMSACHDRVARSDCRATGTSLYENSEEFVRDYSATSDLEFHNFRYIFLLYGIFCSLLLVGLCVHYLAKHFQERFSGISF